jgi:hypothetical protein
VRDNNQLHGSLNHRPQFLHNDRIITNLMKEWVRPERGDGEGTCRIEKHTANHVTNDVNGMIVNDASGVQILVEVI